MQTATATALSRVEFDYQFRAFVQGVSDCLTAVGLVKTNDTGQINPATVLAPDDFDQSRGYEIRRFDDPLSLTSPIYVKVDYGSGSGIVQDPDYAFMGQLVISIGTGSNGAGTLTAPFPIPTLPTSPYGAGDGGLIESLNIINPEEPMPIYASGDGGQVSLSSGVGIACPAIFFSIDRERDNDGQPLPDSVTLVYNNGTDGLPSQVTFDLSGSTAPTLGIGGNLRIQMPYPINFDGSLTRRFVPFDGTTGVLEVKPYLRGYLNPITSAVGVTGFYDSVAYEEFDVFLYGKSMKFKSMPVFYGGFPLINPQIMAMRWA